MFLYFIQSKMGVRTFKDLIQRPNIMIGALILGPALFDLEGGQGCKGCPFM